MNFSQIKSLLDSTNDPELKLELLMDIGKELPLIPPGQTGTRISGCASRVDIFRDNLGKLYANSDSAIVRGLIKVLFAIKEANLDFNEFSELKLNLGASRLIGTSAIIAFLKAL